MLSLSMHSIEFWNGQWTAELVNHLWQSTVVAGVALLLTLALKKNQARVRYWVWMIASAKFLLPFSLLIDAGSWLRSMVAAPIARPTASVVMEQVVQPFQNVQTLAAASPAAHEPHFAWLPTFLLTAWLCGTVLIAVRWALAWMRIRGIVRAAAPTEIAANVPVLATASLLEPGVFGILRPVLLLPHGIQERLKPAQLRAIVVHEMCHVRRRDNLTFALHMISQALFWFHPLTWWIGGRLIEEREHACDEAVLETGGEAEVYAEGILNVCKFCVESPLACAAGVSGADLKDRIARIMSAHDVRGLDFRRKALLGAAGLVALASPLALGLMHAGTVAAETRAEDELANLPKFDVASIKPHKNEPEGMMRMGFGLTPDGIRGDGVPLQMIVRQAFGVSDDRILNEPDWVRSSRYDMEAKVSSEDAPKLKGLTQAQRGVMLLPVLEGRCGLKFHYETRELNVYTLVIAKSGPKLKTAQPEQDGVHGPDAATPGAGEAPPGPRTWMRISPQGMTLEGRSATMESLAGAVSRELGATVIDKTGLTEKYDYTLNFMPENGMSRGLSFLPPPPAASASGGAPAQSGSPESTPADTPPSLADAVQQQLGLKLVSQKEPVEVVVIDQIQQPTPN